MGPIAGLEVMQKSLDSYLEPNPGSPALRPALHRLS
jgi:hypothetical protein